MGHTKLLKHGWLRLDAEHRGSGHIVGVPLDVEGTRTRFEEFSLLAEAAARLTPGLALDAGTGYVKDWHIAPYVLAKLGWRVVGIDNDARTMQMEPHPDVVRYVGDMSQTEFPDSHFDMVVCISVLEHCTPQVQGAFAQEATRTCKLGGYLVVTADNIPPKVLREMFPAFYFGDHTEDDSSDLNPKVSFAIGQRIA